jgi:hypothetical protein
MLKAWPSITLKATCRYANPQPCIVSPKNLVLYFTDLACIIVSEFQKYRSARYKPESSDGNTNWLPFLFWHYPSFVKLSYVLYPKPFVVVCVFVTFYLLFLDYGKAWKNMYCCYLYLFFPFLCGLQNITVLFHELQRKKRVPLKKWNLLTWRRKLSSTTNSIWHQPFFILNDL